MYTISNVVLKLDNVCKTFGSLTAVNKVNIEVKKSEIIGFVGPNGAGKTTTLKMIARLDKPNSGKIYILNKQGILQNIQKKPKNLVEMGFLIDIPHFYNSTPYQLLKYIGNLRNYPKEKLKQRIDQLLTVFNLNRWKYKKVKNFSKGMIQKLGFIAAIIHEPEIIILDEPQTGLDPDARISVRKCIKGLKNMGKTVFLSSHMLYEITEICDKIALINKGSIIEFDTLENLEKLLKTKEIICELITPILSEKEDLIISKLYQYLNPYLEKELDTSITKEKIIYNSKEKRIIIYYDGKEESRSEILHILVNEFKSDFAIDSFTKSKTSQLEKLYTQILNDNAQKARVNRERKSK
ncbi:MAG: ABC transporter ATP-binding protein [Candidatus Odinarchaeota archaeon]